MRSTFELRELQVFFTLADELHFARSAELLGVTPSRVSQVLRTLARNSTAPCAWGSWRPTLVDLT